MDAFVSTEQWQEALAGAFKPRKSLRVAATTSKPATSYCERIRSKGNLL